MLARKGPKLYMTGVFDVAVHSITTAKEQHLYLDTADAALMAGKRVLIVDDVISTGESLSALEALVEKAGGNIVGRMAILAEGDAQNREDILYLEKAPPVPPRRHSDGIKLEIGQSLIHYAKTGESHPRVHRFFACFVIF